MIKDGVFGTLPIEKQFISLKTWTLLIKFLTLETVVFPFSKEFMTMFGDIKVKLDSCKKKKKVSSILRKEHKKTRKPEETRSQLIF